MFKIRLALRVLTLVTFACAFAAVAQAQATRTWVSGVGDDVNPCSRTAPCKTWAGAISKTAEGGEIDALDPGGFGTLNITKSITIEGTHGSGFGSTLAAGGVNGFIVNVTSNPSTSTVILRNLSIQGVRRCTVSGCPPGTNGVRYLAGARLIIDGCYITGFATNGVDATKTSAGNLVIKDTTIDDTNIGVRVTTTVGSLVTTIDNCKIQAGTTGVDGLTGAVITVSNSAVTHNTNFGIIAEGGTMNVVNCNVSSNGTGIRAAAGTTVRIADNWVFNNTGQGISNLAGVNMATSNTNRVGGNGIADDTPTTVIVNK
jgi:Right handed beta helix region